jgi:hypothetical protein
VGQRIPASGSRVNHIFVEQEKTIAMILDVIDRDAVVSGLDGGVCIGKEVETAGDCTC